jgi:AcrR family transcriptional regulator
MTSGAHRTKQPDLVRAKLIAAGIALLANDGRLSIGTVAEAAGVTKGAIQHHFGTREQLLHAIYDEMEAELGGMVADDGSGGSAAWRYAKAVLNMAEGEAALPQWRAMLIASLVEKSIATRWAAWVDADRQHEGASDTSKLLARLAADGLWLSDMLGTYQMTPAQRQALGRALRQLSNHKDKT